MKLDEISKTGGLINAYEAAKLADSMNVGQKTAEEKPVKKRNRKTPKSTLENKRN